MCRTNEQITIKVVVQEESELNIARHFSFYFFFFNGDDAHVACLSVRPMCGTIKEGAVVVGREKTFLTLSGGMHLHQITARLADTMRLINGCWTFQAQVVLSW